MTASPEPPTDLIARGEMPRRRPRAVPLAWANLSESLLRLSTSIAGVTFAVLVIFVQLGFLFALLDSAIAPIDAFEGEIFITSKLRKSLVLPERIPGQLLKLAASVEGVSDVRPIYVLSGVEWHVPAAGPPGPGAPPRLPHPLRVIGIDPARPALKLRDADRTPVSSADLAVRNTVLFDRWSKQRYFDIPAPGTVAEVAGSSVTVVGLFAMGASFASDGSVICSDDTFARLFPFLAPAGELTSVDIAAVSVAKGANVREVRDRLRAVLPAEAVSVRSRFMFWLEEWFFWLSSTPIGFIFGLGTAVGFLVGVIICYQILFAEVSDRTAEFATIKAMGYPPRYLAKVVLQKALFLSLFGYAAGLLGSWCVYELLSAMTGLRLTFQLDRCAGVALLTVTMCMLSGILTVRKILKLDPAELF